MDKIKNVVLMLCLLFSGAFCYAHGEARTKTEKDEREVPIELTECTGASSSDKSNVINSVIDGHLLKVLFSENLGQVSVEITTVSGASVQCFSVLTPNGLQFYIPSTGDYLVTFTLSDGTVYEGDFEVED